MRKILFFDIDGTLVSFQGQMPASTKRALKKVRENGHLTAICSGRSICQIDLPLLELGFDGIVAASGAYVECGGQVIFENHMDKRTLSAACSLLKQADACYSAQTRHSVFLEERYKERMFSRFRRISERRGESERLWETTVIGDGTLEERQDVEKLNYFGSKIPLAEIQKGLSEYCDVTAMSFGEFAGEDGEISAKGINKALGIEKMIRYLGIERKDTIAFGDGPNDLEMIEYAGIGIAMGNAMDALKERADYVTADIDSDGIEQAMQKLGLL